MEHSVSVHRHFFLFFYFEAQITPKIHAWLILNPAEWTKYKSMTILLWASCAIQNVGNVNQYSIIIYINVYIFFLFNVIFTSNYTIEIHAMAAAKYL